MQYVDKGGVDGALYMRMQEMVNYIPDQNIINQGELWKRNFPILLVSLGLSYPKPPDENNWVERTGDDVPNIHEPITVPHLFNEDCYIYNWFNNY